MRHCTTVGRIVYDRPKKKFSLSSIWRILRKSGLGPAENREICLWMARALEPELDREEKVLLVASIMEILGVTGVGVLIGTGPKEKVPVDVGSMPVAEAGSF